MESTLFKLLMSIRRKVAKGEVDFFIERMLFIFVMHHSSHRSYPCTHVLVCFEMEQSIIYGQNGHPFRGSIMGGHKNFKDTIILSQDVC